LRYRAKFTKFYILAYIRFWIEQRLETLNYKEVDAHILVID